MSISPSSVSAVAPNLYFRKALLYRISGQTTIGTRNRSRSTGPAADHFFVQAFTFSSAWGTCEMEEIQASSSVSLLENLVTPTTLWKQERMEFARVTLCGRTEVHTSSGLLSAHT